MELVWEHRVFTTHQLATIFFSSPGKARHRLLELHRLTALERFQPWTPIGTQPFHWVLGPAGAQALAAQRGVEVAELGYRRAAALAVSHSRQLGHQVGVNEFFTRLHAHTYKICHEPRPIVGVTEWWSERRCAALWGDLARPDAYGRWTEPVPGSSNADVLEVDFFLEHDTGTETLGRVADKLAGYANLAESTGLVTPVLFWLPSTAREINFRKVIGTPEIPVATAVQTPLEGISPAGPVWLPAGGPAERRLRLIELGSAWQDVTRPGTPESR